MSDGHPPGPRGVESAPHDELLDHAYDGIQEFDNPLPRWWVWLFAGSVVFSIGYYFHYHVSLNGTSVAAEYAGDVTAAREQQAKASLAEPVSEEALAKLMADAALMKDSQALFGQRCAACHADKGQGLIGPNLTDNAWLHGKGSLTDVHTVIEQGVLAKGMPAWGKQLSPIEVRKLAAYVGTLRGKALPGKAPEGALVEHY